MNRFNTCLPIVLGEEGGYVDHPHDRGGATSHGVTQATYDRHLTSLGRSHRPVIEIEAHEIEDIYRKFWDSAQCDRLAAPLDLLVFDAAINSGPPKAIVFLQRALGMVGRYQTGNFGPITTQTLTDTLDIEGVTPLCRRYLAVRRKFYLDRVRLDPTQDDFIDGWLNRIARLEKYL